MGKFFHRVFFLAVLLSGVCFGQGGPNTRVSLISDAASAVPGSKINVGIRFQLEPGWHIYWINPGDSGEPATINWRLPAAWKAGPILWPAPHRMTNPAGVDYGYEGDVLLLSSLELPKDAFANTEVVNADLHWLICKNMCVSQKGSASLIMQVVKSGAKTNETGQQAINAVRARLPKTLPADWKANIISKPTQFLLNFRPGAKVEKAEFYPLEKQVVENAAPQKLSSTSTRAQLVLKKDEGANKVSSLKGVLVINDTDAYNVDLPFKGGRT
jgi:DsbC/DsbD-like thiol-disulfide interchange protein